MINEDRVREDIGMYRYVCYKLLPQFNCDVRMYSAAQFKLHAKMQHQVDVKLTSSQEKEYNIRFNRKGE